MGWYAGLAELSKTVNETIDRTRAGRVQDNADKARMAGLLGGDPPGGVTPMPSSPMAGPPPPSLGPMAGGPPPPSPSMPVPASGGTNMPQPPGPPQGAPGNGLASLGPLIEFLRSGGGGAPPSGGMPAPGAPQAGGGSAPMPAAQPMPQQPQPQPQQPQQPQRDPSLSATAQPTGMGYHQDSQATLSAMAQRLVKFSPNLKPAELFLAMGQQIAMMKGVEPESKAYLMAEVQMQAIEQRYQAASMKAQTAQDASDVREQMLTEKLAAAQAMNDQNNDTRRDVAGTNAGARRYGADRGLEGRKYGADRGLEGRRYGADKGYQGKVDAAGKKPNDNAAKAGQSAYNNAISNGQSVAQAKAARADAVADFGRNSGGGGGGRGATSNSSAPAASSAAKAVVADFKSGRISKAEATARLQKLGHK